MTPSARRLSYKFQRLRERIRAAIDAGELAGKLPGERNLARQFNVNAKTLSKALTDLAAEGVLERNIGLGTFVRGGGEAAPRLRVLLLAEADACLENELADHGVDVQRHSDYADLPPSLLAPFHVVLVASAATPDAVVRDLIVRGKTVLTLDRMTTPYVAHAVIAHTERTALAVGRALADLGHRRVLVMDDGARDDAASQLAEALPSVHFEPAAPDQTRAKAADGYTAAVCGGQAVARQVLEVLRGTELVVPDAFSVAAFGRLSGKPACCGHYVSDTHVCRSVADVLRVGLPHRPLTLWLAGEAVDVGTMRRPPLPGTTPQAVIPR